MIPKLWDSSAPCAGFFMPAIRGRHPSGHCCAMLINAPGVDAMPAIRGQYSEQSAFGPR